MTRRRLLHIVSTRSAVLVVGSAVVVASLAACGSASGGFRPHPEGNEDTDTPVATSEAAADVSLLTDQGPVTLTPVDTETVFGRPATVATTDDLGGVLAWELTVHDATVPAPDRVRLDTQDTAAAAPPVAEIDNFLCFTYTLTYLGIDRNLTPNTTALGGSVDPSVTVVTHPSLTPAHEDTGADANEVLGGAADSCDVPVEDRLPTVEGDLVVGRTYRGAVLGYQSFTDPGNTPTVVRFDFDPGVPGASTDTLYPSSVFWGME